MEYAILLTVSCLCLFLSLVILLCARQIGVLRGRLSLQEPQSKSGLRLGDPLPVRIIHDALTDREVDLNAIQTQAILIFTSVSCAKCRAMLEWLARRIVKGTTIKGELFLVLVDSTSSKELADKFLNRITIINGIDIYEKFMITSIPQAIFIKSGIIEKVTDLNDENSIDRLFNPSLREGQ
jgi:hypothetical protein